MKRSSILSFFFLILSFIFAFNFSSVSAEEPRYRIAAILPLSGPLASWGSYVRKGLELAEESLTEEQRKKIELVYEDDSFDPKRTVTAYQQILARGPLNAIFVVGSPPALALMPMTEKAEQILIGIGASDPEIVKNRSYSFTHWVTPVSLGSRLAQELLRRKFQRIAFLTIEASGAMADTDATIAELEKSGAKPAVVFQQTFPKEDVDFRSTITTLKSRNADVVVLVLAPEQLASFGKQQKQLGLKAEICGMESLEDESAIRAAAGTLDGVWYVNGSDPTSDFADQYRKRYSEAPGWATSNAFDSLRLVAEAVSSGQTKPKSMKMFLQTIRDYVGAAGKYSASGDNRFTLPASLKRIAGNEFVTIEASSAKN